MKHPEMWDLKVEEITKTGNQAMVDIASYY